MMRTALLALAMLLAVACAALAAPPGRIVSLAPSMTEILFALGLGENIVGVTTFCDYPPEAREKPRIGGMSNPSLEAVVSSRPDIVMMTTDGNPQQFESRLSSLGIRTFIFRARRIRELPEAVREVGAVLDAGERAEALARRVEDALSSYGRPSPREEKALFVVWPEPLMVAGPGTAIDDVLMLLGYENVASDAIVNYPKYSVEEAIRRMPDVIFIGNSHTDEMEELSRKFLEKMRNSPAVRSGRVYFVSDNLYRLGPRILDGIAELAETDRAERR